MTRITAYVLADFHVELKYLKSSVHLLLGHNQYWFHTVIFITAFRISKAVNKWPITEISCAAFVNTGCDRGNFR